MSPRQIVHHREIGLFVHRRDGGQLHVPESPWTAFDAAAARAFGQVATSLRRGGRKPAARSYDAMIAAIAVSSDLPLYTCSPDDFATIGQLHVIEVPHPAPDHGTETSLRLVR